MQPPGIKTKRLLLQPPTVADVEKILVFIRKNKAHLTPWEPWRASKYYTEPEQTRLLNELLKDPARLRFYIFEQAIIDTIIGEVNISNIVHGVFQNCQIGYKLDQEHIGRGYMQEALTAVIGYIFQEIGLHRVEANIIPRNVRSIRLIERLGFRREGLAKRLLKINGIWEDHYRYAFLAEEWL